MPVPKRVFLAVVFAALLIAGCAAPPQAAAPGATSAASWRGRLAVKVGADQAQSFSAGFELVGNPQAGELTLFTPLGTTLASLSWSDRTAVMRQAGNSRHFGSLDALIKQALGTEVPVTALFAWLCGDNMSAAGWSADLSHYAKGSIQARRSQPAPEAQISLLLEQ
ncbi:MAG: lipoprotein insertase outer membrane protein LolB [Rhodoferax sp.]